MRQLLQPIVSKFDELLRLMSVEPDADLQLAYAACISQAMGFARYTSLSICTLAKLAPFLTLQLVCFHVSATVRKVRLSPNLTSCCV